MMKKAYARGGMQKKGYAAGGASMKKKMMAAGGNMKKKGYAAGGASGMKKKMMAAGGNMMKKGYAMGGLKEPSANQVGLKKLPTSVRNNMGYMKDGGAAMYKKGYAAGGAMMKKKMMSNGGATSSYDTADRAYPGAGKKRTSTATSTARKKKPVVTKAMMTKAGVTSLRDFYNKMEVNAAGTGYKKRSKALTKKGSSAKPTKKTSSSYFGIEDRKYPGSGRKPRGTTTTSTKPKRKKSPGAQGNPFGLRTLTRNVSKAFSKRGGFK